MKKDYKKILVVIIAVLLISLMVVYKIPKLLINKSNKPLPEVKLRNIKDNKSFAIMIQNENGYEEYTSEDNTWPGSDYVYKEAKCTDNNGALVEGAVTYKDGKVTLTTNQTIYCTLYFDMKVVEITNAKKICDMGTSMSIEFTTSDAVEEYYYSTNGKDYTNSKEAVYAIKGLEAGKEQKIYVYAKTKGGRTTETKTYNFTTQTLGSPITGTQLIQSKPNGLYTTDLQGGMYRYQGIDNIDNYIIFGTTECTSDIVEKYMYRIIGITTDGKLYLIKEYPVEEEGNTVFSWYKATSLSDSGSTLYGTAEKGFETWPESAIYKRLNGISNGTITGDGQNATQYSTNKNINANTNIFVESYTNEYPYLKKTSEWYSKIENHDWMYGDTTEETYDGHKMYQRETGDIETKCTTYDQTNGHNRNATCQWNKETNKVQAKIGLPYIHDILLAYYDGNNPDTRGNPGQSNFTSWINNIIKITNATGTMVKCHNVTLGSYPTYYGGVYTFGTNIFWNCTIFAVTLYTKGLEMHPTFYLTNSIQILGKGTLDNPYIIKN